MRPHRVLAAATLGGIAITLLYRLTATASAGLPAVVWGGKMEHCAIAVGMIGGAILGVFANPLCGPIAFGVVTAGLVWLLTCE